MENSRQAVVDHARENDHRLAIDYKGKMYAGVLKGFRLDFPIVYIKEIDLDFEISWALAHRALFEGAVITG